MIVSKIIGGLGNQLFQYAAGISLAQNYGEDYYIDTTGYSSYKLWNYELNKLNISAATIDSIEDENTLVGITKYREKDYGYKTIELEQNKDVYLDGYFQDERYFKQNEQLIRKEFLLKADLSKEGRKWLEIIESTTSPVSVITRRGDYLLDPDFFGTCSPGYFNYCINDVIKSYDDCTFFVFTDDMEWSKNELIFPRNYYYVDDIISSPEKMYLISKCNHHIIANSTFAWWGAWLCENERKRVYVPIPWVDGSKTLNPIIEEWIKVDKYYEK